MKITIPQKNVQSFLEKHFKTKKFNFSFRDWDNGYSIRKSNQQKVVAYYYPDSQELLFV